MPVRFRCQSCNRRISGSQRKIGGVVNCPVCGQPTPVIPEGAPASALSRVFPSIGAEQPLPDGAENGSNGIGRAAAEFDDVSLIVGEPQTGSQAPIASPIEALHLPPLMVAAPERRDAVVARPAIEKSAPLPRGQISVSQALENYVLVSRRALYVQGGLFCLVALVAGLLGYFIGRSGTLPSNEAALAASPEAARPEIIKGAIVYSPKPGQRAGDHHALVFILPLDPPPANGRIAAAGLTPADAGAAIDRGLAAAIEEMGGGLAKADSKGAFQLTLRPREEQYVLIVSRSAERPQHQPIDAKHLAELSAFFDPSTDAASKIIGSYRYAWLRRKVSGAASLEFAFE